MDERIYVTPARPAASGPIAATVDSAVGSSGQWRRTTRRELGTVGRRVRGGVERPALTGASADGSGGSATEPGGEPRSGNVLVFSRRMRGLPLTANSGAVDHVFRVESGVACGDPLRESELAVPYGPDWLRRDLLVGGRASRGAALEPSELGDDTRDGHRGRGDPWPPRQLLGRLNGLQQQAVSECHHPAGTGHPFKLARVIVTLCHASMLRLIDLRFLGAIG